jgi:hypothetical protein
MHVCRKTAKWDVSDMQMRGVAAPLLVHSRRTSPLRLRPTIKPGLMCAKGEFQIADARSGGEVSDCSCEEWRRPSSTCTPYESLAA